MSQFEANNLGRLDSLALQQTDFLKRLDTLDYMERQTKRNIDELKGDLNDERKKEGQNWYFETKKKKQKQIHISLLLYKFWCSMLKN